MINFLFGFWFLFSLLLFAYVFYRISRLEKLTLDISKVLPELAKSRIKDFELIQKTFVKKSDLTIQ